MGAKGQPKTGGRKKGSVNKSTEKSRELFHDIMSDNVGNVKTALAQLYKDDKRQFLDTLSKYFPYFIPKQSEIDINVDTTELPFDIAIESRKKTNT